MMDRVRLLIELLKVKKMITPLEQDILDTWNELSKCPFDMESAKNQAFRNDTNYPDVCLCIASLPTTVSKPYYVITEDDVRYSLTNQLAMLVEKEWKILNSSKRDICLPSKQE
ncbi:hypothetical protein, partial [Adlercreutzia sp. ZJ141]|uniref:hypothetical protein n=1 Tax=Adlercreutzia sp. ZJ141 TaxID=2709406 RepID=UPI0019810DC9